MAGQYVLTPGCEQNQKMFQRLDDAWEPLPGNGHIFVSEISMEKMQSLHGCLWLLKKPHRQLCILLSLNFMPV